ncbi:MAG: DUF3048 domain-containing protein [Clostridiaceae bacterium]
MKKTLNLFLLIFLTFTIIGCGNKTNQTTEDTIKEPEIKDEIIVEPVKYYSPFTGEEVSEDDSKKIAFMTIVENSYDARPQSGVIYADVVYETLAEGGIPRFMLLFQKNDTDIIGPVRSARPYFDVLSKEYNLAFAHCGGSDEAIEKINNEGLMSLNEFAYTNTYWRDNTRYAPHNLYTSSTNVRDLIKEKNYSTQSNIKFDFDTEYWNDASFAPATDVDIKLSSTYDTNYQWNNGKYEKYMDGEIAKDRETKNTFTTTNIIIQITDISSIDTYGHLFIEQIGKGNGYFISNGKMVPITWSKSTETSQTMIYDLGGNEVPFNTGNTWWEIVDNSAEININ